MGLFLNDVRLWTVSLVEEHLEFLLVPELVKFQDSTRDVFIIFIRFEDYFDQ